MNLRVLIVDDEPLAREGIALLLKEETDIEILEQCSNGPEAIQAIKAYHGGPHNVESGKLGYQTKRYTQRVLALYQTRKHFSKKLTEKRKDLWTAPRQMFLYKRILE